MGRIKIGAALATVVALVCAAQGLAAPGGALKHVSTVSAPALGNPEGITVSPDGKHVYGVGFAADEIGIFSRNRNSGKIKLLDDVFGDGLQSPRAVVVSPDGKNVYVAGASSDTVHVYARAANGGLTFLEAERDGFGGVTLLQGPYDVAISPDGKHVYAVSLNEHAVNLFNRLGNGELTFVDDYSGVPFAYSVAVSSDGKNVYVTSSGAVLTFKRNKATGELNQIDSDGLGATLFDVTVSPDGKRVYVADADGVHALKRNAKTGKLGSPKLVETGQAQEVAVAPAGDAVYATVGNGVRTVAVRKNGGLKVIDFDGFAGVISVSAGVAVSPDGRHVVISGGVGLADAHAISLSRQPTLTLKGKAKQAAGKLAVRAACNAKCRVTLSGKGLKKVSRTLAPGKEKRLRLFFKGAPPSGGKLVIKGKAKAGNRKAADKLTVRLK